MQFYKPGSVPTGVGSHHLSSPIFTNRVYQSTLPTILSCDKIKNEPPKSGLFDLSTREVCRTRLLLIQEWALTPLFHPYLG